MAGLMAAWARPGDPQAGPSEPTAPRKKIPKVAVYVSGATASPPSFYFYGFHV